MISDETPFPIEPCKIEDVRYKVFRFQVSTDQKVGGSSCSYRNENVPKPNVDFIKWEHSGNKSTFAPWPQTPRRRAIATV